jgi:hypothetical protein
MEKVLYSVILFSSFGIPFASVSFKNMERVGLREGNSWSGNLAGMVVSVAVPKPQKENSKAPTLKKGFNPQKTQE